MPDGKKDANQFCPTCGLQKSRASAPGSITGYMFDPVRCKCTAEGGGSTTLKPVSANSRTFAAVGADDIPELRLPEGAIVGGSYSILELIGSGGMGVVYQARHMALGKRCAIKLLPPDQVTSNAWARFQLEAKSVAGLDHKNIVKVTDLGLHKGYLPFYAMEYIQGQSLAERLAQLGGPLEIQEALAIFIQICSGIDYAHRAGIIHRDLKPANIMLGEDGTVKILDFGLAKLARQNRQEQSLTSVGDIFGSPYYMSPEQCAGQKVDNRSDIYSLGCTLFECLTGRPPFNGNVSAAVMFAQQESAPPSVSSCIGKSRVPDALEIIMAKLLRKNPAERYQTCRELMLDLERASRGEKVQPVYVNRAAKPPEAVLENSSQASHSLWPRAFLITAALMTVVGVAIGAGFYFSQKPVTAVRPIREFSPDLDTPLLVGSKERDNQMKKQGAPTSSAQTGYYSTDDSVGKAVKTFNFPTDIRLGTVSNAHIGDTAAVGKVILDGHGLKLWPGPVAVKYPRYLSRFRPGELQKIVFSGQNLDLVPGNDDDSFEDINACCHALTFIPEWQHIPSIGFWHLNKTPNADSKKILRGFDNLHRLEIAGPATDCANLAAMPFMKSVGEVELSGASNSLPLFKALEHSSNFTLLATDRIDFSDAELSSLAKIPKLDSLLVKTDQATDVQLTRLSALKSLRNLNIPFDALKSLESIRALKLWPALKRVHIINAPQSPGARLYLVKQNLPGVLVDFEEGAVF